MPTLEISKGNPQNTGQGEEFVLNTCFLSHKKDSTKTERKLVTIKGHVTLRYSV